MSTGAIIGIACGAGALFLGSIILFVIYWRKQRRYDDEENYYPTRGDEGHFNTSSAAPVYTLDYKGDEPSVMANTPQTSHTGQSGFTPLVEMASAMPAHPAYIPRALVRQNGSEKGKYINTTTAPPPPPPQVQIISSNDKVPISAVDISGPLAFPPQAAPPPPPPPPPIQ
ncbi:hypothetical protein V8F20_006994, partial [Naviculisporaceae sp. PSN 640]